MALKDPKTSIPADLIAPCGMNCALCSSYQAWKHQAPRVRGRITYCSGCRPRNKQCAFLKKRCPDHLKLLKGEVEFCDECSCFPCELLVRLDARYRERYGMSMILNLKMLRERGMEAFLADQYARYRCPRCGDLRSVHSGRCLRCDPIPG